MRPAALQLDSPAQPAPRVAQISTQVQAVTCRTRRDARSAATGSSTGDTTIRMN